MRMPTDISDAELLAYLDEGLSVERMVVVENELRQSAELRSRAVALREKQDTQGHSVGEIWRLGRLTCPTRHQLGSFLLGALPKHLEDYYRFHLTTVGCRYCAANLEDLKRAADQASSETATRRQKFFQSSAGYLRQSDRDG
jgi:hypothetical protein